MQGSGRAGSLATEWPVLNGTYQMMTYVTEDALAHLAIGECCHHAQVVDAVWILEEMVFLADDDRKPALQEV
ncbi:hypothetical protein CIG75_18605 [Tumebacillus algifaecis]|uniref:Uncharacterized protein n=1 Tax=Tumebacillus algifaecis TaxID=1214604 RepID=A0A223D5A2_9BACL|nr:hypothetical protein [Tumebacillus algifaecis]ASS76751.1 hypothetical protein CIG75_18605 [Tumebacillus algifaecis]